MQAADYFAKTVLLNPDSNRAYLFLADSQMSAGNVKDALQTLDRAAKKFPPSFAVEYMTAMAFTREKDYTNALPHFTQAEILGKVGDTNRLSDVFYFQFGATCERAGDYAEAEINFEKCLKLAPDFAEALNYLGYMWADRGEKLDSARGLIEKALKADPKNAAYLDSMGWVLFKLKQPAKAVDYILKAIKYSDEADATIYEHLGDIYAALGQSAKAHDAWSKSLSLEPSDELRNKLQSPGK